jgi:hypothetical protein
MQALIRNTFILLFASWGIHLLIVAFMGTFYDVRELKEILGGNSTLPVFLPSLVIYTMVMIVNYKHITK